MPERRLMKVKMMSKGLPPSNRDLGNPTVQSMWRCYQEKAGGADELGGAPDGAFHCAVSLASRAGQDVMRDFGPHLSPIATLLDTRGGLVSSAMSCQG